MSKRIAVIGAGPSGLAQPQALGDYVTELIAETDFPSFDVEGACAAFLRGRTTRRRAS